MQIATKSRRSGKAVRRLTNVVSVALTLFALAFMAPSAFGLQRFVITGDSMGGSLDRGSVAFAEVVPVSELKVGDVITYLPPASSGIEEMVTHRIIKIKGDSFRTKGDAVPQPDPWKFQLDKDAQPRVVFAVPYVGYFFMALADRTTRIVVIGVPAGLITLVSLVQFLRALRARRRPAPLSVPDPESERQPEQPTRTAVPVGG